VLFYCQHSLGLGHLARSLMIAGALVTDFEVVLLNGGRFPAGTLLPAGVTVVNLAPLGHNTERHQLVSHDEAVSVDLAKARRHLQIIEAFERTRPQIVLIEMYPFGRKAFEFELLPLLEAAAARGADRPKVLCSLRDILVSGREDQARHDERVAHKANRYFDGILVHSDPTFARLEDSFRPATPLEVPVHYTGYVAPAAGEASVVGREPRLIVSSGGGMVGEPLVRAAVEVHAALHAAAGLTTTIVAGPFLPEPVWTWLQDQAERSPALNAIRRVPDLAHEIRCSALSLSQGGYNTTMDLLRAQTPAVVVPYDEANENEQTQRARRLAELGALRVVRAADLGADVLLPELLSALASRPLAVPLDLGGAGATSRVLSGLLRGSNSLDSPSTIDCPSTIDPPSTIDTSGAVA
jgi:predicted glycosyltransferase